MLKRPFDFLAALVGLIVLAIPLMVIGCVVLIDSGRPVLFRQTRVGLNGKLFQILKFRTMITGAESSGRLSVSRDSRVTRVGRALRRFKVDELPQLLNVLKGDMSLVGPRPEVPEFASIYPEQTEVWSVRPGITDPTSIELYDEGEALAVVDDPHAYYIDVLLPEKTKRYLEYVRSRTLRGDIAIIFKTLARVANERSGRQSNG